MRSVAQLSSRDVVLLELSGAPPDARAEWDGRPSLLRPATAWRHWSGSTSTCRGRGRLAGDRPSAAKNGGALARGRDRATADVPRPATDAPKSMVDLDAATLARVEAERRDLDAALAAGVGERLWRGPFRTPVEGGQPTGGYGLRRLINGQPRSPHTGYDWAAPAGTPVLAANAGRVALVAEHFFAGRNVMLDHGLGLFTLYFHLTEARVVAGESVAVSQVIGTVGATGRVTGPHLHFAVLLGGARVDPESLLRLAPPEERGA